MKLKIQNSYYFHLTQRIQQKFVLKSNELLWEQTGVIYKARFAVEKTAARLNNPFKNKL